MKIIGLLFALLFIFQGTAQACEFGKDKGCVHVTVGFDHSDTPGGKAYVEKFMIRDPMDPKTQDHKNVSLCLKSLYDQLTVKDVPGNFVCANPNNKPFFSTAYYGGLNYVSYIIPNEFVVAVVCKKDNGGYEPLGSFKVDVADSTYFAFHDPNSGVVDSDEPGEIGDPNKEPACKVGTYMQEIQKSYLKYIVQRAAKKAIDDAYNKARANVNIGPDDVPKNSSPTQRQSSTNPSGSVSGSGSGGGASMGGHAAGADFVGDK